MYSDILKNYPKTWDSSIDYKNGEEIIKKL